MLSFSDAAEKDEPEPKKKDSKTQPKKKEQSDS